jgi:hypothetical protein
MEVYKGLIFSPFRAVIMEEGVVRPPVTRGYSYSTLSKLLFLFMEITV